MSRAFDAAADSYDRDFTSRAFARELRGRVWDYVDREVAESSRMLELGCGTGEDARHFAARGCSVTALDASAAMVEKASKKILEQGLEERVELETVDLADLGPETWSSHRFDLVFSNFGVLNCLDSLTGLGAALAGALRPGGRAILVIMGRFCPAEMVALLLRGRPREAFRRWRSPGSEASLGGGSRVRVWYPSPGRVERELGPGFRRVRTLGLGTVLPPPDLIGRLERVPRLYRAMVGIDRALGSWPLAARCSDHYLIDLERTP